MITSSSSVMIILANAGPKEEPILTRFFLLIELVAEWEGSFGTWV